MLSNQSVALLQNISGNILSMLTWPAGASLPKVGEDVVYYHKGKDRTIGTVKKVEHEHLIKDGGAPEINVTIWLELR